MMDILVEKNSEDEEDGTRSVKSVMSRTKISMCIFQIPEDPAISNATA